MIDADSTINLFHEPRKVNMAPSSLFSTLLPHNATFSNHEAELSAIPIEQFQLLQYLCQHMVKKGSLLFRWR